MSTAVGGSASEGQRGYNIRLRKGQTAGCLYRTCDKSDKRATTGGGGGRVQGGLSLPSSRWVTLNIFDDLFYDLCGLSMYMYLTRETPQTRDFAINNHCVAPRESTDKKRISGDTAVCPNTPVCHG